VCHDKIAKIYYKYAKGARNGALLEGRTVSSFAFEPSFEKRPMPPLNK
jgi:glutathione S-transferase